MIACYIRITYDVMWYTIDGQQMRLGMICLSFFGKILFSMKIIPAIVIWQRKNIW